MGAKADREAVAERMGEFIESRLPHANVTVTDDRIMIDLNGQAIVLIVASVKTLISVPPGWCPYCGSANLIDRKNHDGQRGCLDCNGWFRE